MKRLNTICTMATLLLAGVSTIVSCTKDDEQPVEGKTYHMTVTASKGGDNAKALTVDGTTISATWAAGETVTVYNVTKGADLTGNLAAQSSGASTTLEGDLTGTIEAGDELTLKFCSPDYSMQDGTLAYIAAHCDYAEATVTVASVAGGEITASGNAAFENKQAIVKFSLMDAGGTAISAAVLSVTVDDVIYATIPASATNELYVALPGISGQAVTLSAKVGGQWYNKTQAGVTFVNGQYYTVTAKLAQKGMLPGTFSVGGGKKVHFSQGNLKYTNGTWSFHTNQYDYLGVTGQNMTTDNMDLFSWAGSGKNYGATDSYDETGDAASDVVNWGECNITNGGGASQWQTLTGSGDNSAEWYYLFNGRGSTSSKYGSATVCGIHGMVVLPDNWTLPGDCSFTSGMGGWNRNSYDATSWPKMEAAGAVFLPAAGFREGTDVTDAGDYGYYWSSSARGERGAWCIFFFGSRFGANDYGDRYYGQSVRLVCE